MSSLASLRSRLQKFQEERDRQIKDDTQGRGTTTSNFTDITGWQNRIQEQGNKPEEWLQFLNFISRCVNFTDNESRRRYLCSLYDKGINSMPADDCKKNDAYANFLIDYANLKSQDSPDEAQELFNHARIIVKTFAAVHIAAAQFHLSQGNKGKCRKILEKAKELQAKPIELLNIAFRNYINDKQQLLSDEDKENLNIAENKSVAAKIRKTSADSDSGHDSSTEIQFNAKPPLGNSNTDRNRHISSSSFEEADTIPVLLDQSKSAFKPYSILSASTTKPVLRSYHSTPDCQNKGPTSMGSSVRRKNVGKAVRVVRTSLPQLSKGGNKYFDDDNDDDNGSDISFGVQHLAKHGAGNISLNQMTASMESATISPPTSDSGISFNLTGNQDITMEKPGLNTIREATCEPMETEELVQQKKINSESKKYNNSDIHKQNRDKNSDGPVLALHKRIPLSECPPEVLVKSNNVNTRTINDKTNYLNKLSGDVNMKPVQSMIRVAGTPHSKQDHVPVMPQSLGAPVSINTQPAISQQPAATIYEQQQPVAAIYPNQQQIPAPMMYTPVQKPNDVITVKEKSYFVMKIIGRGGSSKVFKVFDFDKKQELAIKVVNLEGVGEATLNGYLNEITLLNRLQCSNRVIKLYDYEYNAAQSALYVVMEAGDTDLSTLFKSHAKQEQLTPIMIQFYWQEMLKAVGVLHKEGIIHSDLKPANFILVAGKLKLIDFGIANAIQQDKTSVILEMQVGTLNFMSPESILGQNVDPLYGNKPQFKIGVKSDVWSLGCILYNMVYGKTPFQHITNQMAKLQAITNPAYTIEFPNLDNKELLDILKGCLQRDPKVRPSINELLERTWNVIS